MPHRSASSVHTESLLTGVSRTRLGGLSPPYTAPMAEVLSADDLKRRYIEVMRAELGEFFHHLMQEASRLHLKWNEYEALFNAGREKVENMNRAAPGFFWITQNALWHDIILSLCRITDNGSKVLSVKRLPGMTKVALRDAAERAPKEA